MFCAVPDFRGRGIHAVGDRQVQVSVRIAGFTKIYAVPGIRLGYGISSDKALLERMETVRQPWSVSTPAQAAGLSALKEDHREEQTRQLVKSERERMEKELENLRIEYIPSEANFLLFNSEINWFEELKKRGS